MTYEQFLKELDNEDLAELEIFDFDDNELSMLCSTIDSMEDEGVQL